MKKRIGKRQGRRVRDGSVAQFTAAVREFREAIHELVQLAFYLVLSSICLAVAVVGAVRLRLWLG